MRQETRDKKLRLKDFIVVTKPGIIFGNLLVAVGAYLFGAGRHPELPTLTGLFFGTGLVIAGSCVLNNYLDRNIDARMTRTARRPSVTGAIPLRIALPYATVLILVGCILLWRYTNPATMYIGLIGAVWYVAIYGLVKRTTHWSTLIGTISGSTPPLAGYVAATNSLDVVGWSLFAILVAWQMPHFYAIALFRARDYASAGLPVLSVAKGLRRTVLEMRLYAILFVLSVSALFLASRLTGTVYGLMLGVALWWLWQCNTPVEGDGVRWARRVFRTSLLILPIFALLWALDPWLRAGV